MALATWPCNIVPCYCTGVLCIIFCMCSVPADAVDTMNATSEYSKHSIQTLESYNSLRVSGTRRNTTVTPGLKGSSHNCPCILTWPQYIHQDVTTPPFTVACCVSRDLCPAQNWLISQYMQPYRCALDGILSTGWAV